MPEGWRSGTPSDDKRPFVKCAVMSRAQGNEIVWMMAAPLRARLSVMHVHECCVPAAWHATSTAVAAKDLTANGGRHGLLSACGAEADVHVAVAAHASIGVCAGVVARAVNVGVVAHVSIGVHVGGVARVTTHVHVDAIARGVHVGVVANVSVGVHVEVVADSFHAGARSIRNRSDVLRVALRHLQNLRAHFDELAAPFLPALSAALANRQRHLVARAPCFSRPSEYEPREREERGIVIERLPRIPPNLRHRFSKRREHLPCHLESQRVPLETRLGDIARQASRALPGDESFDVASSLAASDAEPGLLRARDGDARELAHRGKADSAGPKRLGCRR